MREFLLYKPFKQGGGHALKAQFQLETEGRRSEGGLWLELAPQIASDGPYAKFDWNQVLRMKLGVVDLSKLLLGYRVLRIQGFEALPQRYQPTKRAAPTQLDLVHSFTPAVQDPTVTAAPVIAVLMYDYQPTRGILQLARGEKRSIALELHEELALFEAVFQPALEALVAHGVR